MCTTCHFSVGGILPGSYHYLHIAKPAIPTPLEVQMAQPDFVSIVSQFHFTFLCDTVLWEGEILYSKSFV
jgi:hypothetical protein